MFLTCYWCSVGNGDCVEGVHGDCWEVYGMGRQGEGGLYGEAGWRGLVWGDDWGCLKDWGGDAPLSLCPKD